MKNPCGRCVELDFCQEGTYGEPCKKRVIYEEYMKRIRRDIQEKSLRQKRMNRRDACDYS